MGPDNVVEGQRMPMAFVGIRGALHLKKPEWLATWQPFNKTITFDPLPKRRALLKGPGESFVRTAPAMNGGELARLGVNAMLELSAPYHRLRHKDEERDIIYEQPEDDSSIDRFLGGDG